MRLPHIPPSKDFVITLTSLMLAGSLSTPALAYTTGVNASDQPTVATSTSDAAPGGSKAADSPSTPPAATNDSTTPVEVEEAKPEPELGTRENPLQLSNGSWIRSGNRWWWLNADGTYPKNIWATEGTSLYRFDESGWMHTGWFGTNEGWYYLTPSGAAARGWAPVRGAWYYLDPTTAIMKTGWVDINGQKYYLHPSGAMATGWISTNEGWYYLTPSGAAARGWASVGGAWYYLDPTTAIMKTGWVDINGQKYYLRPSGAMADGWTVIDNKWFLFNSSGKLQTGWILKDNAWYYLDPDSGTMRTGWINDGGKPYFLNSSGAWQGYVTPGGYLQPTNAITSLGWSTNTLTNGMNGVKVRIVRRRLGIPDSGLSTVNESFMNAVRNFQRRVGLPRTGVVDERTWNAMGTGYSWYVDQYQATPVNLGASRSERIEAMIAYAQAQIGSSYTWGGAGPYNLGFDCSGLVLQSLYRGGMDPQPINVVKHAWPSYRSSRELYAYSGFKHVPLGQRQRGDIVFYQRGGVVYHTGIYLGGDQIVHTDMPGRPARIQSIWTAGGSGSLTATVVRPFP